jgi:nickel/cobalt transporter (NicO) family protein
MILHTPGRANPGAPGCEPACHNRWEGEPLACDGARTEPRPPKRARTEPRPPKKATSNCPEGESRRTGIRACENLGRLRERSCEAVARPSLLGLWMALALAGVCPSPALGHDIPNQRVDRSIQVTVTRGRLAVDYEVSLTELTLTQDLRALIGSLPGADRSEWFGRYGSETAPLNAKGILVSVDGLPAALVVDGYDFAIEEHPRYTFHFHASLPEVGRFTLHDTNYQTSEGTSRLAVRGQSGVAVEAGDELPSNVEEIPIRPMFLLSDAEERRTKQISVSFRPVGRSAAVPSAPIGKHAADVRSNEPGASEKAGLGRISRLLDQSGRVSWLVVMMIAMGIGAAHAIQPGHGKSLVTAVALGPRARLHQPVLLGLATTLAHTGSVLLIAAVLWFTGATRVGDLHRGLTKLAGFTIAAAGCWRIGRFVGGHDEHALEELRPAEITNAGIVGLGLAGGMVPCWDAVGLLVLAAAIGRLAAGVVLVLAFSAGMAAVLVAVGCAAWRLKSAASGVDGAMRWQRPLGLVSAVLLALLGLYLFFEV